MHSTTDLSTELARLRDTHEAARLTVEIRRLEAAAGQSIVEGALVEEFGDVVDRREYLTDDPAFGFPLLHPLSVLSDREAGKLWPIYQCEQDLAGIRGRSRNLATFTAAPAGILDALANYVLGPGFTFTARAADGQATGLATAVQGTIDRFLDENAFCGGLDREAHSRSREEGEAFLVLSPRPNAGVRAQLLECEQITEPADTRPLEDWLGCGDEFPSCWKFGVHTPARETDQVRGYHVVYDGTGIDWDYVPVARMEHFKRNVPANAKRGVSDFYPVLGDLEREARLRRNTAAGAALQAAIAWIVEVPAGTVQAAASAGPGMVTDYKGPFGAGGIKTENALHYAPGTILRTPTGQLYKPGPMGSERNPNFVVVGQYVLRGIAARWNMPEYLISSDASNANYASSLIAESPFVKAREADQQFYRRHFGSLLWKVVRLAWEGGRFARLGVSWEALEALLEIKIDAPAVATRDALQMARTQEVQIGLGILSRQTAAAQAGLDYDAEVAQGAAAARISPPSQGGAGGVG